ncbi:hypothetical protein [Ottowia sp. VDI28]|uniref:hypothetical protein n=1 Tax=Ottowia sp. VDI28 TaxID=3133968 RepID=UPI003C2C35CE
MKANRPTFNQVADELARLKAVLPRVPKFSGFGDNNHAAIEAQIKVLEDHMSRDDVHDCFGEDAVLFDFSQNTLDCALTALDWMTGDQAADEGLISAGWEAIAK